MRISLLTIGDELLRGKTVNTNAAFLGEALQSLGVEPQSCLTVPDRPDAIRRALNWLLPQSDIIITSGGLGSTGDDLSREAIAAELGLPLESHPDAAEQLRLFLAQKTRPPELIAKIMRQALAPVGAEIMPNAAGTAPGLWISHPNGRQYVAMLPGPPRELHPMTENYLLPRLRRLISGPDLHTRLYYVAYASELWVEEQVLELLANEPADSIIPAYCADLDHVKLFLSGHDREQVERLATRVEQCFGKQLLRAGCTSMPTEMVDLLRERKWHLSTAESCTGGLIAASITDIAGSSDVFDGSIVSYSNRIKNEQLDVAEEILRDHGAVSAECVTAMVNNLCRKFKTETGIAVSGIAGPGGGSAEKPVGLVYIAVRAGDRFKVQKCHFPGTRDSVRRHTVSAAWFALRELLLQD